MSGASVLEKKLQGARYRAEGNLVPRDFVLFEQSHVETLGTGSELEIKQFGAELSDFADTAAIMLQTDLVISVCTSAAHLAGALNRPLWLLSKHSPDFRWLLDRDDSPWYPSARIFRQPKFGDWDAVIDQVKGELGSLKKAS